MHSSEKCTVSFVDDDQPVSLDQVRELVEETTRKLGSIADLFLIHNPFVAKPGELKQVWNILEDLKTEGRLKTIGVSNFRVQDLEAVLKDARYIPVVNQVRERSQFAIQAEFGTARIPSLRSCPS
jgi:diketogulonate reductase-like aldo/keto reductase